jgi:hypothetical protein
VKHQRILVPLATIVFVALAVLPAVVVFSQGWLLLPHRVQLPGSTPAPSSSANAWALFALFYLGWMVATVALLIVMYDRAGFKYTPYEGKPREPRRKRRRRGAALRYMAAQEKARAEAGTIRPRRKHIARPADADPMAGRPPRKPPAERGQGGEGVPAPPPERGPGPGGDA